MPTREMEKKAQVTKKEADGEHPASHYLVVEDPQQVSTWHLRVKDVNGSNDHRLMGACWAALHEGFRGNRYEGPDKQKALEKLKALYKQEKMELPSANGSEKAVDDAGSLIAWGGAVKALGNGRVGGYLVTFTTEASPDLDGDFFTKDTDFGDATGAPVYYQHGMDAKLGKRRIGKAEHRTDDFGVWAEAQLNLRDEYEKFLYSLAERGKLGWSSGTAPHLVEREKKGNANWIKTWPLGLDDTLTPVPAEPRNDVIALKSWVPEEVTQTLADKTGSVTEELKQLIADYSELIGKIDKPLSEPKRQELKGLLEMFSGMDAVRSDLQSVLSAAPPVKLVGPRLTGYQLAEARKRLTARHILQE